MTDKEVHQAALAFQLWIINLCEKRDREKEGNEVVNKVFKEENSTDTSQAE